MEKQKSAVDKLIAKYNKQWNKYGMGSVISYSQVVAELEKVKEEMKQEQSQKKENQSLEEFINSQPYYGHCTPEYLEGIEVGAKWQEEKAKEMENNQSLNIPTHHLNKLAERYSEGKSTNEVFKRAHEEDFKAGFQKALELLTFKSE